MKIQTHYVTLGLHPNADPAVIRATYKALVLLYHPDKTLHLAPDDRAARSAIFREVQEAYDVLGDPLLKVAYDSELAQHSGKVNSSSSTSHNNSSPRNAGPMTPRRKANVRITTRDEKLSMKAKTKQELKHLDELRAQRDTNDAQLDITGLKFMLKTWKDLAEESVGDPMHKAHCAIEIHSYEQKIKERELQQQEWLAKMSTARHSPRPIPVTPGSRDTHSSAPKAPRKPSTSRTTNIHSNPTTPTPTLRATQRAEARRQAEADRAKAVATRAQARADEKAQREAVKIEALEKKAAAIRAEKEKQKQRKDAAAEKEAEHIAWARAKAGAAPKGTVGASQPLDDWTEVSASLDFRDAQVATESVKRRPNKLCDECGEAHTRFREWRECAVRAAKKQECTDDETFFRNVQTCI